MESIEDVRSRSAYGAASQLEDWIDEIEKYTEETGEEEERILLWVIQCMTYAMFELRQYGKMWDEMGRRRVAEGRPPQP